MQHRDSGWSLAKAPCGTTIDDLYFEMNADSDFELARAVAEALAGKFWQVTAGDWWVIVEGVSNHKLVVLTNDPFGIGFTPKEMNIAVAQLRGKVLDYLVEAGIICEDGSWASMAA